MKHFFSKYGNILLIGACVVFIVATLAFQSGAQFSGADGEAESVVSAVNPEYQPWVSSFWEPPSSEIESLLFSLQAAVGSGLLFFILGYYKGLHSANKKAKR